MIAISGSAALAATVIFTCGMVLVAILDLTTMKIPNRIVLSLLAAYLVFAPLAGFGPMAIGSDLVAALSVLAGTFLFFILGWLGGGDSKLAAVSALWIGTDNVLAYLLYTAVFGGVLTVVLLKFRAMVLPPNWLGAPWLARLHSPNAGVPYGIALASAALFVFPHTPWMSALT
ncbi:A24 family peptidase [Microvirga massiliensis]|uniref:A24 family peptidase n=1 Tax=Microvirga massiliensis TaxID=1033741 RepID=UPI00062B779C|nr:prepilin peptidase [Microvirga massiliensis]